MTRRLLLLTGLLITSLSLSAQYFGRNKPRYKSFNFDVLNTEHFSIHHECKNEDYIQKVAQDCELWYDMHSEVLRDEFTEKNPMLFYNTHPEFEQTTAIRSSLSQGTGGVTEAFKNRVILPFAFTNQQTNHVIGHELVHAFQYHMVLSGDSTSLQSLSNLPLWMVEGLAEYMSKGKIDPFTAMWMRDAVMRDEIPELKKLNNPKYFPYRWGQAVWSFLTGLYGDDIIRTLYMNTAKFGLEKGFLMSTGLKMDDLSEKWVQSLKDYYSPYQTEASLKAHGKPILTEKNSGRINIAPRISPNGRLVAYLSEKDVFSIDLFVAEINTGDILAKVTSRNRDGHLDELNYIESAGTWSADGQKFAFVAVSKGRNVIVIKSVTSGKTLETIAIDEVPAMSNLDWSPVSNKLVFTGMNNGRSDLYEFDVDTRTLTQLTDSPYSEILPSYSVDGKSVVYSTDHRSFDEGRKLARFSFDIAILDIETGEETIVPAFPDADNMNPQWDHEGNILFLSDRDGFRNLYKYDLTAQKVFQLTDLYTGISGITAYAPAISASRTEDLLVYTYFTDGKYSIVKTDQASLSPVEVDSRDIDFEPGTLPIVNPEVREIVNTNLLQMDDRIDGVNTSLFTEAEYEPKLKLNYISGGAGAGVATSNTFGNYSAMQGAIQAIFGDMLGENELYTTVALNGELEDGAAQFTYLNQKSRLTWGASFSHIPTRTGYNDRPVLDTLESSYGRIPVVEYSTHLVRIFDDNLNGFVHFPINTFLRVEGGLGASVRNFSQTLYRNYYQYYGGGYVGNELLYQEKEREETGDLINFSDLYILNRGWGANANVAFVGDKSFFGLTSPLDGYRFRISADRYVGADDYLGLLADVRKYWWFKPVNLSVRGLTYFKFDYADRTAYPFYIGQMGFVHGFGSLFGRDAIDDLQLSRAELYGTKIGLGNVELRMPFTGPEQLALIKSKYFYSDLALFYDIGTVFDSFDEFDAGRTVNVPQQDAEGNYLIDENNNFIYGPEQIKPLVAQSIGISMRVNLLGAMILEPYYAFPLVDGAKGRFGMNITPGW